ncbi:hypothetical protein AURDEDRAFT_165740 [Auricularia subglabra TFB-10046 SS5]|nr:hypothetical protein AURDEDRAFT_165740 [Auricularia subglabra TFB-10046 SS5]
MEATAINIMVFSRFQQHGKLQNFLSMFFKAEGAPVRCFDTLNAFVLSVSRAWVDRMVSQLSEKSLDEVREFVLERPVCIPSDNLRTEMHGDSQRIDNQSLGVNCTAIVLKARLGLIGLGSGSLDLQAEPEAVHGKDHRTRAWTLGTVPIDIIDQASYEGNAHVLDEILRQLGLESVNHQMRAYGAGIPFAGDLLTVQRFRGLKGLRCEDDNGFDRLD